MSPSHDRLLRHQKYLATAVQGTLLPFWVILREGEIESVSATLAPIGLEIELCC